MEKLLGVAKISLKYNLLPHIVISLGLCLIAPFVVGVKNLDQYQTAKVLEYYLVFLGLLLLPPLFLPDQDENIRDLIRSKKTPLIFIQLVRILEASGIMAIFILGFLLFLKRGNCEFIYGHYLFGTFCTCLFIGGIGVLAYGFIDHIAVAYMIPCLYYVSNYGSSSKYLGRFYLSSMTKGEPIEEKLYLLIGGVIMIVIAMVFRHYKEKMK